MAYMSVAYGLSPDRAFVRLQSLASAHLSEFATTIAEDEALLKEPRFEPFRLGWMHCAALFTYNYTSMHVPSVPPLDFAVLWMTGPTGSPRLSPSVWPRRSCWLPLRGRPCLLRSPSTPTASCKAERHPHAQAGSSVAVVLFHYAYNTL